MPTSIKAIKELSPAAIRRHRADEKRGAATTLYLRPLERRATMITLQGTLRNGQVVLDAPTSLPEGTRVEVLLVEADRLALGMREEDWPTTPEGIAALLSRMDLVEPGWLSPADDSTWRAALRAQKEIEKAQFFEDAPARRSSTGYDRHARRCDCHQPWWYHRSQCR